MTTTTLPIAKFRLGKIVSTPNALDRLTQVPVDIEPHFVAAERLMSDLASADPHPDR